MAVDQSTIANGIFNQALQGSAVNPGVPEPLAALITQQAMHETAGFTSNAWIQDHNGFGYKYVGSRYQSGRGIKASEGDYYGHYPTYQDSVKELIDWIYRRKKAGQFPADLRDITTPEEYAKLLKQADYYGDTIANYLAGLKRWAMTFSRSAAAGGVLIVTAVIVALIWIGNKSHNSKK